ncbi:MAG: acylphosphatase [Gammaproteobacteria bacterium]|nr:acylphosphatase [Gammaproteobacteria bacterium]
MDTVRIRLRISGRVQGVWFRASTREQAKRLRVTGWVRNCDNGEVEVLAEGTPGQVGQLVEWCHRGPPAASVADVVRHDEAATGEFLTFDIV